MLQNDGKSSIISLCSLTLLVELRIQVIDFRSEKFFYDFLTGFSGRTETVTGTFSMAWMKLNRTMRMNNIRNDLRSQERFEKPGEKRRRLRSERWRRRFAEEVGIDSPVLA